MDYLDRRFWQGIILWLVLLALGFAGLVSITPAQGLVIEHVQHKNFDEAGHTVFPAPEGPTPAKGESFVDAGSGLTVTRLTDVGDIVPAEGVNWGWGWEPDGNPKAGFYNGYARWSNVNVTGEYMIAFRTNNHSSLYKTDGTYLGPVVPDRNHAIGESCEIRWDRSGRPGTETRIYYHYDSKFYQQDVLEGYSSAVALFDFAPWGGIWSTGDMDCSDDARYWAIKCRNGQCVAFDAVEKQVLPGEITQNPNGLDISPDGKWFVMVTGSSDPALGFRFYQIDDLRNGETRVPIYLPTTSAGHNGWARDKWGQEVLVYQDNKTDWICAFNPETGENTKIIHLSECGWGMNQHIGRLTTVNGWALVSTYSSSDSVWSYNQIFLLEIAPVEDGPRIWRIGRTYNRRFIDGVDVGGYFAEAFASINPAATAIYWGANWRGQDNLEIYRVDLPEGWEEVLNAPVVEPTPTPVPTPTPTPTPTPEPTPSARTFRVQVDATVTVEEVK